MGEAKGRGQGHEEMVSVTRSEESSEQHIHVIFNTASLPRTGVASLECT